MRYLGYPTLFVFAAQSLPVVLLLHTNSAPLSEDLKSTDWFRTPVPLLGRHIIKRIAHWPVGRVGLIQYEKH